MFKFNFSSDTNTEEEAQTSLSLEWLPAEELHVSQEEIQSHASSKFIKTKKLHIGSEEIFLRDRRQALVALRIDQKVPQHTSVADNNRSDLEPSKYEGGLKLWECTFDLGKYVSTNIKNEISGKDVLDMGCGAGIIGILCLKAGAASVHFQDYNIEVLKHWTVPNVSLNASPKEWSLCNFWSGDWASFRATSKSDYDLILMSETIYNPDNYDKVIDFIIEKLRPNGKAILAAKSYYFGLGGSVQLFIEDVQLKTNLICKSVFKQPLGVQREIIEITKKP